MGRAYSALIIRGLLDIKTALAIQSLKFNFSCHSPPTSNTHCAIPCAALLILACALCIELTPTATKMISPTSTTRDVRPHIHFKLMPSLQHRFREDSGVSWDEAGVCVWGDSGLG